MKVLCSACEAAEARVLCCADEAALCAACDREVHAANRLAGKHQRLPLLSPAAAAAAAAATAAPKCDICQECYAYFFCLEDRALLCRNCDVAVHTANAFVSGHRRFLLTGVQVGLEAAEQLEPPHADHQLGSAAMPPQASPARPAPKKSHPASRYAGGGLDDAAVVAGSLPDWAAVKEQFGPPAMSPAELPPKAISRRSPAAAFGGQGVVDGGAASKMMASGGVAGNMPEWPLEEFFGFSEFSGSFGFPENGTSKADSGKLGSSEGSDEDPNADEFFGEVPGMQWSVPEIPSPPTASGLHWQTSSHRRASDAAVFVPDICSQENSFRCFTTGNHQAPAKRRRRG